jgi:thioredoxin 1
MYDHELEKIRQRKAERLLKLQTIPKEIVSIKDEEDLKRLSNDFNEKIIVIDFWAVWCGPCKIFAPIFQKIQQEYYGDFIFAKINVDENPFIAQQFGITAVPTTLFLKGGQVLIKQPGAMNYYSLKNILEKLKVEN